MFSETLHIYVEEPNYKKKVGLVTFCGIYYHTAVVGIHLLICSAVIILKLD